ncbi:MULTISPECIES: septum formation initiator family protein [Peptoniphilus]|uniref:FtsB family cell division protein n=1 Tax=Peptoniphilus TaxID=162289 RepID=UPI0001DA9BF3|nr:MULTISPECIES: septum formation initiator family protein [Peptoniphilus]EFI42176.1 putative cell division protein FtsL [Peptoniphilus sp. oral taxon 386 str. F0131]
MFKVKNDFKIQKNKIKKINRASKRPLYITLIIVMMVVCASTLTYAQLSSLDKKIMIQQKEISELKKTKMSLIGEVKGIKSSTEIQDEAMYKLGMIYPKENQIVYVDISKDQKQKDVNNNVFLSPIISVLKSFTKD